MENNIFELQYAMDTFYFLICGALVMLVLLAMRRLMLWLNNLFLQLFVPYEFLLVTSDLELVLAVVPSGRPSGMKKRPTSSAHFSLLLVFGLASAGRGGERRWCSPGLVLDIVT